MDTDLLLYPPLVLPAAAALVYAVFGWRTWTAWSGVGTAAGQLAAAIALGPQIVHGTARTAAGGLLRADALTGFMLIVISAVALIATWASVHHIATEQDIGRMSSGDARRYGTLIHAFLAAVGAAVLADNLGLMWVALEATTVITAFLVGHRRDRASLEAAWKYVVLCSVGIAMAFLGTVCVYATALHLRRPRRRRPRLDLPARPREPARSSGDPARRRARRARVRHQGGVGPDARLAA